MNFAAWHHLPEAVEAVCSGGPFGNFTKWKRRLAGRPADGAPDKVRMGKNVEKAASDGRACNPEILGVNCRRIGIPGVIGQVSPAEARKAMHGTEEEVERISADDRLKQRLAAFHIINFKADRDGYPAFVRLPCREKIVDVIVKLFSSIPQSRWRRRCDSVR